MKIASSILLFAGIVVMIHSSNGLLGLRYNTDFSKNLGVILTDLSTAFGNLNSIIAKAQVQDNILLIATTQPTKKDLAALYGIFTFFKKTYLSLKSSFSDTAPVPGPLIITGALSTGVAIIDTMLPTIEKSVKDIESVTSVQILNLFPSEQQQSDVKTAFKSIVDSINKLALRYRLVTQDEVNAALTPEDQKTVTDFFTFYLNSVKEITVQFNTILNQFTSLASLQTSLLKASTLSSLKTIREIVTNISQQVLSSKYETAIKCASAYQTTMLTNLSNSKDKLTVIQEGLTGQAMTDFNTCVGA